MCLCVIPIQSPSAVQCLSSWRVSNRLVERELAVLTPQNSLAKLVGRWL